MLNSCAHNEARPTPILRSDCDKWALVRFAGDVKYASAADALELGWIGPPSSNDDLLVVKVEQYMIRLGHLFVQIFGGVRRPVEQ